MDGLLILDKPRGCTSHDVVLEVRRLLRLQRVGHAGTLDPEATGVLIVALGQATRFFPYLSGQDKAYAGTIRLGYATDTYDATGRPTSEDRAPVFPSPDEVSAAMKSLEGVMLQSPPPYSAKKLGGRPAYRLARARKTFALTPVRVTIRAFTLKSYAPPFAAFEAACSSGTYIRSLAHELGQRLGCGAHLFDLRRTASGPYGLDHTLSLGEVESAAAQGRIDKIVIPLEELLPEATAVILTPEAVGRARNGSPVPFEQPAESPFEVREAGEDRLFRLFEPSGRLLGLARLTAAGSALRPVLVIP